MSSLIGRTLSHYRVISAIGSGGMGEVYRATDTTLGRDVAIKVLPSDVASDRERLARFRREAHLLASLNHPNIAAIHGLEEVDGAIFIALELVEGEDLRERLTRGPIPVDEAIDIATQVAEALEDAHNHGIVHRDLKPANVKLSSTGRVKVLDFGLAKAWASDASGSGSAPPMLSRSPTLTHADTIAGVVLGTAAYMAPEQARGKAVDRRADVWAFGVLFWEMLTGRPMFSGETVTDVIASVVTREPDLAALPSTTPPAVRRLIERCLRKDPRQRLPDIGAARLELQELKSGARLDHDADAERSRTTGRPRGIERLLWITALVLSAGAAAALAFVHFREVRPRIAAARFTIDPPAGWEFNTGFDWPVPSPDGRQIVFTALPSGRDASPEASLLWTRSLDALTPRPLPGTEGGTLPAWSPDGSSLAFVAGTELRRFNMADGAVQRLCTSPAPGLGGLSWNDKGLILFSAGAEAGRLYVVPATGGDPKLVAPVNQARGERYHHNPQFLPGDRFLFLLAGEKVGGVYVSSLSAPTERQRVADFHRSVYAAGHLFFVRDTTLFAQPFDLVRAQVSGDPVALASSVVTWPNDRAVAWFGVSPAGTLAYFAGQPTVSRVQLAWVDRKGTTVATIGEPENFGQLALSPDGRTIALELVDAEGNYDLWAMDVARGVKSRVTTAPGNERDPVWSPDGGSLAFIARHDRDWSLRRKGLRASDAETVILHSPGEEHIPEVWLHDGSLLVNRRNPATDQQDSLWQVPAAGGSPVQVLSGVFLDEPQVSPDGHWIAYISRESGQEEVYVEPFRRKGERVRVSPAGGGQPKWRADGRELFLVTLAGKLATVSVREAGERLEVSLPTDLFDLGGVQGPQYDDYAPTTDGQRFLVKLPVGQQKPKLTVLTNWTSLVR